MTADSFKYDEIKNNKKMIYCVNTTLVPRQVVACHFYQLNTNFGLCKVDAWVDPYIRLVIICFFHENHVDCILD